ncbi:DSD1 family PLP-dependent enzyme [Paracoccus nototheniae]|uniref:DSD1 family PLP-dependent enzyme n=1 Tax=Paracoccus nototheniae TaxID=2489002 RepID=UPI0013F454D3|nr:DSD1 family PLP-dependent enzyme [Paracoccus nototheniae]
MTAPDAQPATLHQLETPCLVLDRQRMDRNIARLAGRAADLGVTLRPHLKTVKSAPIARLALQGPEGPATVSTLKEARQFVAAGITDLVYAVGISPAKLPAVIDLIGQGGRITVLLDSVEQAQAVAQASRDGGVVIPALIEIDCDGHRSGLRPDDAATLVAIGTALMQGATLRGVLTHAGESYGARGRAAQAEAALLERDAVVRAAGILRAAGLPCPVVSVGSTPTAHAARDLTGVTELRAGVYVFFDLVMAGIGVCDTDDIALSVLTTVIGHRPDKGWIITDAGWMAMSRDRGTAAQAVDQGYGLVCGPDGALLDDLMMIAANQEHGILALRPGSAAALPDLKIGDRLRILPNHACATAAQHDRYHLVEGASPQVTDILPRFSGW